MSWIKKIFGKKENKCLKHTLQPPKGWYVEEAGQNPLHMLWYVVLVNFDDACDDNVEEPRHFIAEECDSFEEALRKCIHDVNNSTKSL